MDKLKVQMSKICKLWVKQQVYPWLPAKNPWPGSEFFKTRDGLFVGGSSKADIRPNPRFGKA
jgi:hypothetical protein